MSRPCPEICGGQHGTPSIDSKQACGPCCCLSVVAEIGTFWRKPKKPQVKPGDVALVFDEEAQVGEAVTIARIADDKQGGSDG